MTDGIRKFFFTC